MIDFIDVSQFQGNINFSQVPQQIVFMKLSGGDNGLYTDARCYAYYGQAKQAGKSIGQYHFAGGGDPVAEAKYFWAAAQPVNAFDVFALDFEIQHYDPVGWCNTFINEFKSLSGVYPLIYINLATLNAFDWSPVLANCGLWLADWNGDPSGSVNTTHTYVAQQWADNGSVAGISGNVDRDSWFGTLDEFNKYGIKPITPPVVVETPAPTPVVAPVVEQPVVVDPVAPVTAPAVASIVTVAESIATPTVAVDPNTPTRPTQIVKPVVEPVVKPQVNWLLRIWYAILRFFGKG